MNRNDLPSRRNPKSAARLKRRDFLKSASAVAAAAALPAPAVWSPAKAQSRQETLLVVSEYSPNNFDIHGVGTNRPGYEVSWNCYDRLMSHGEKTLPDGTHPTTATSSPPSSPRTGTPPTRRRLSSCARMPSSTTARRSPPRTSSGRSTAPSSVGGFPTFQMKAGSLEKPEQFVAVDDHTFRVDFIRKDKLTMPDLAVIVPAVYHSELVKKNATEKDPWGLEYTKTNIAGGGAYKVTRWQAGTEVVFERNDDWKSGPLPKVKRVVWRTVPSAGNRRALIERGDADISFDLPNKDFAELKQAGKVGGRHQPDRQRHRLHRHELQEPALQQREGAAGRGLRHPLPEDHGCGDVRARGSDVRRQARRAAAGRLAAAAPLQRPTSPRPSSCWPRLAIPNGFETTLSFDLGFAVVNEPLCVLVQESLAQIGIKTTINKIPGSNWRNELLKKEMPLIANFFSGWLDYPEYFFFWCYHGQNAVFNTMSYQDKDMDAHDRRGAHRGGQRRQGGLREERRRASSRSRSTRCRASRCSSRR